MGKAVDVSLCFCAMLRLCIGLHTRAPTTTYGIRPGCALDPAKLRAVLGRSGHPLVQRGRPARRGADLAITAPILELIRTKKFMCVPS